jgi:O-antigen chain-terminating methyltransferase
MSYEEKKSKDTSREAPGDVEIPVPALRRSSLSGDSPGDPEAETEYIGRYLDFLAKTWDIQNDSYHISSHQPVIGPVLVHGRYLVHDEVRRYVDPVIFQQTQFNANTLRILSWMFQRIRDLEMQLEDQKKSLMNNNQDLFEKK